MASGLAKAQILAQPNSTFISAYAISAYADHH